MSPVRTPLLDRVRTPADLRNFSPEQLRQLADELRAETIDVVSVTGGHLGSALAWWSLLLPCTRYSIRRMTGCYGMSGIRPIRTKS